MLADSDDVESVFSKKDLSNDDITFVLVSSDTSPVEVSVINIIQQLIFRTHPPTIPSLKIHLVSLKFDKPISIIGFIDTGSQRSMFNPAILPVSAWEKHTEFFKTANGE